MNKLSGYLLLAGGTFLLVPTTVYTAEAGSSGETKEPRRESIFQFIRDGDDGAARNLASAKDIRESRDPEGNTPLIVAAHLGTVDSVKLLLEAGAAVDAANPGGVTALLRAAADPDKVALLLEAGADPNVRSKLGHTPLMLAARSPGATGSVKRLLSRGSDVNVQSNYGATALMAAAAACNLEAVELLVEAGAEVDTVPLPDPDKLKGGNPDPIWGGMRTALMWAAFHGDVEIARYLLDHGADVNAPGPFGTPLSQAGVNGHTKMAALLLERGAKVDQAEGFSGFTVLHWAASSESREPDLVALLLKHGADPNAEGGMPVNAFLGEPQTPLRLALQRGDSPVAAALRKAGAKEPEADRKEIPRPPPAGEIAPEVKAVWTSIAKAIPPLQHSARFSSESFVRHVSNQNCASCHQQYMPMMAVGAARKIRVPVDEAASAAELKRFYDIHQGEELMVQPLFHPEPTIDFGYALLGLRAEGVIGDEATDARVHYIASLQCLDGHWDLNLMRPPIQSSEVTATALAIYALRDFGWPARTPEFESRIAMARDWLWKVQPAFHEEQVFQLLGLAWAGVSPPELEPLATALLEEQRQDAGWGQQPGLGSDAYATGQALFALHHAVGLTISNDAFQRGVRFLLQSQDESGAWHVVRRAFPFQPTMDSGFPFGRDGWISAAATSWAAVALAAAVTPHESEIAQAAKDHGSVGGGIAPAKVAPVPVATPIDFVRDIQPLLERSCVDCHSGAMAKSNFRVTTREAILSKGDSGSHAIVPGNSRVSPLARYIAGEEKDMEMPPLKKRAGNPALTSEQILRVRAWIDQGAPWQQGVELRPATLGAPGQPPKAESRSETLMPRT